MHPLIAYDLAKIKMADLQAEASRERLAATARAHRPTGGHADAEPTPVRWMLRRFFAKLHLAGAEA